jgi:hypothetical protein
MSDKTPIDDDEDEATFNKRRNAERLSGPEAVPIFAGFMMASMAGGNIPSKAAGAADLAMAELRKRFT